MWGVGRSGKGLSSFGPETSSVLTADIVLGTLSVLMSFKPLDPWLLTHLRRGCRRSETPPLEDRKGSLSQRTLRRQSPWSRKRASLGAWVRNESEDGGGVESVSPCRGVQGRAPGLGRVEAIADPLEEWEVWGLSEMSWRMKESFENSLESQWLGLHNTEGVSSIWLED